MSDRGLSKKGRSAGSAPGSPSPAAVTTSDAEGEGRAALSTDDFGPDEATAANAPEEPEGAARPSGWFTTSTQEKSTQRALIPDASAATETTLQNATNVASPGSAEVAREPGTAELFPAGASTSAAPAAGLVVDAGQQHLRRAIEAIVFASEAPLTVQQVARLVDAETSTVRMLLNELVQDYAGRGVELVALGGAYHFRTAPACAPFIRDLVKARPVKLSRAQLETLAIVAYRQPVTRPELEEIRGVDSGGAVKALCDRGLVKPLGRKEEPGRPLIYGTSRYFLDFFSLSSLRDLPTLREFSELSEESQALFERQSSTMPSIRLAGAEGLAVSATPDTLQVPDTDEDTTEVETSVLDA